MKWAIATAIFIVIAALALAAFKPKTKNAKFSAKIPLSKPEQILYYLLVRALPNHIVLAQVAFSRFLKTTGGSKKENYGKFATARQKVADFLICNKNFM